MAVDASIPKGTRDFLPTDVLRREYVIDVIRTVYRRHGFEPLETPTIENLSTLTGKYGEEGDQLMFKILKRGAKAATGECDLGLRYDLTVPLARVVAMYQNDLPRIFKRYQIQPVWRADRPARGRYREFYQCDIDVVGAKGFLAEVDLLAAVYEAFEALGFGTEVSVRINDRRILRGLIEVCGIDLELETDAITAIDKLDKIGLDGVRKELDQRGVSSDGAEALLGLLDRLATAADAGSDAVAEAMREAFADAPDALAAVDNLITIRDHLPALDVAPERLQIDPYLARGLGYYTGPIFEVTLPDLAGSLAGGGRYDGLIGMFLGRDIPSVGLSLGLERILVVMAERDMFPAATTSTELMVGCFSSRTMTESLRLAQLARAAGINVDVYPQKDKLKKQFKYADQRAIPFVALIGPGRGRRGQGQPQGHGVRRAAPAHPRRRGAQAARGAGQVTAERPWWRDFFDADYRRLWSTVTGEARTEAELAAVLELCLRHGRPAESEVELEGWWIADVCGGDGRIARPMQARTGCSWHPRGRRVRRHAPPPASAGGRRCRAHSGPLRWPSAPDCGCELRCGPVSLHVVRARHRCRQPADDR